MTNHIPRRSGIGMRQVLAPVRKITRHPKTGEVIADITRMRPAPNPFITALKARREVIAAEIAAAKKAEATR